MGICFVLMDESLVSDIFKEYCLWLNEGDIKLLFKKFVLIWFVINLFCDRVEVVEGWGVFVEEFCELLGRGCVKKGIFEGDLEEGEFEIG